MGEKWTKEQIEELKRKPYAELTSEERKIVNLNPIKKGEVRNPNGRKKGSKNWATRFQKLMNDSEFLATIISHKPKEWDDIVGDTPAEVVAAAIIANTARNVAKSISSDAPLDRELQSQVKLLNDLGFGERVVHEAEDGFFDQVQFNFEVVPAKNKQDDKE